MIDDGALTNNGIHQLFTDKFQGQKFTLQLLKVFPSQAEQTRVFMSDGRAWIQGKMVGEAKQLCQRSEVKDKNVVQFKSEDIEMIDDGYTFVLKRVENINTTAHKMIGEPIPYDDQFKAKGLHNVQVEEKEKPTIVDASVLSIEEIKLMKVGQLSGAVLGKVIWRPQKVTTFMNIRIQDQNGQEIQICIFGSQLQKFSPMLTINNWYRFENPQLQMNNRLGELQLKLTGVSNVVKVKNQNLKEEKPGIFRSDTHEKIEQSQTGFSATKRFMKSGELKPSGFLQKQFILAQFDPEADNKKIDYFLTARVLSIGRWGEGNGARRFLSCVDKHGDKFDITVWNQYDHIDFQIGETYFFRKMEAKNYGPKVDVKTRGHYSKIEVSEGKIVHKNQIKGINTSTSFQDNLKPLRAHEQTISLFDYKAQADTSGDMEVKGNVFAHITVKSLKMKFEKETQQQIRRKMIIVRCLQCAQSEYARNNPEPLIIDDEIFCSECKKNIKVLWNITVSLFDNQAELQVAKLNSEITVKLLQMNPEDGLTRYYGNYDALREIVAKKLSFLHGVFKVISKVGKGNMGAKRYFNVVDFFANSKELQIKRSEDEFKKILALYNEVVLQNGPILQKTPLNPIQGLGQLKVREII